MKIQIINMYGAKPFNDEEGNVAASEFGESQKISLHQNLVNAAGGFYDTKNK